MPASLGWLTVQTEAGSWYRQCGGTNIKYASTEIESGHGAGI